LPTRRRNWPRSSTSHRTVPHRLDSPTAERLLEIIGEAANALSDDTKARHPELPWADVTRLRIVLAHHYHRVDAQQVWVIARDDVPALVQTLEADTGDQSH